MNNTNTGNSKKVSLAAIMAEKAKREKAKRELLKERCNTLWFYFKHMDDTFFKNDRPHLMLLSIVFQMLEEEKIKNLIESLPRRYGKSYGISLFTTWFMSKNKKTNNMRNSYAKKLSERFSRDIRELIDSDKNKEVFPNIALSKERKAVEEWVLEYEGKRKDKSTFVCGGVGASVTGFGCNGILVADDLIKDAKEAFSNHVIGTIEEWKESCHDSSAEVGCKRIECATRWATKDPIGRIKSTSNIITIDVFKYLDMLYLATDEEFLVIKKLVEKDILSQINDVDEDWVEIKVPALRKVNGNSDHDISTCEVIVPTKKLLYKRKNFKSKNLMYLWNALYQQEPEDKSGVTISRDELKYFELANLPTTSTRLATCDVAFGGGDYLSLPIIYEYNGLFFVPDVIFDNSKESITRPKIVKKIVEHKLNRVTFEANNGGKQYADKIRDILENTEVVDESFYCNISSRHESANKLLRISINADKIITKCRFLRSDQYEKDSPYARFIESMTSHKIGIANQEDNAIDSMTLAVMIHSGGGFIESEIL